MKTKLSDRIRPNCEAAPWVIDEVRQLEADNAQLRTEVERLKELNANLSSALKWAHDELAEIRQTAGAGEPLVGVIEMHKTAAILEREKADQLRARVSELQAAYDALYHSKS